MVSLSCNEISNVINNAPTSNFGYGESQKCATICFSARWQTLFCLVFCKNYYRFFEQPQHHWIDKRRTNIKLKKWRVQNIALRYVFPQYFMHSFILYFARILIVSLSCQNSSELINDALALNLTYNESEKWRYTTLFCHISDTLSSCILEEFSSLFWAATIVVNRSTTHWHQT